MSLSSSVPQLSSNAVSTSSGGLSTLRRGGGKPATLASVTGATGVKKERKKKDPNEPQKPVSAYALFFRDTQAAIKGQNPNASFGEVSKIVASMWDSLAEEQKQVDKFVCYTVTYHLTRRKTSVTGRHFSPVGVQEKNGSSQKGVFEGPGSLSRQQALPGETTLGNDPPEKFLHTNYYYYH